MKHDETESLQKVLIADDNVHIMNLMRKFFAKAKKRGDLVCEILEAGDGKQAIEVLEAEKPDLILCDINMPTMSGYTVLRYFNNTHLNSQPFCFFAFLTSSADEIQNAFAENVMGFVSKNEVSYYVLSQQIKTWLRLSKLERNYEILSAKNKELKSRLEGKEENPANENMEEKPRKFGDMGGGFFSK